MSLGAQGTDKYRRDQNNVGAKQMKFELTQDEVTNILNQLVLKDKSAGKDDKNIRNDHSTMAMELIESLMPFNLPTEIEFKSLEEEIERLKKELIAARMTGTTNVSSEEDEKNRKALKDKKKQLKDLKLSLHKLRNISQKLVTEKLIEAMTNGIEWHASSGVKSEAIDGINIVLDNANKWLKIVKEKILDEFPLEFDEKLVSVFADLPKQQVERFQLLHAKHIVNLKRAEINAVMHPDDENRQKNEQKEYILFQIETSQLQHDIINAIRKDDAYNREIIESALEPILKEFLRGEKLGAYKFRFPQSIAELLNIRLTAKLDLLKEREKNEIELSLFREQYLAYAELSNNFEKYGVKNVEEGKYYENLRDSYEQKMNDAMEKQVKSNQALAKDIGQFITENSIDDNNEVLTSIKKTLGPIANQEIGHILAEAEKRTELGWLELISTQTFASRCKRAMAGLVTAGGVGGLGGAITGLGILAPVSATLGMLGGGVLGGVLGFMSPDITQGSQEKMNELKQMTLNFIWGETNKVSSEYFKDPVQMIGLNPKYLPTDRMREEWGEKGAEIIAVAYVNLLFDLHVKLLYTNAGNREELEQIYKHYYRNYQMLRGDEKEIRSLYKSDQWGQERAETQIDAAKRLNLREQLKIDLATMMLIVDKERKDAANQLRNAISTVANGIERLTQVGDETLLLQLKETPEIKLLPDEISTKVFGQQLMLESPPQKAIEGPKREEEGSSPLALIVHNPETISNPSHEIMIFDKEALEHQALITTMKENAVVIARANEDKQQFKKKLHSVQALSLIATDKKTKADEMDRVKPDFFATFTQLSSNMSVTEAAESLKSNQYEKFKYWYENIFLVKYKSKSAVNRLDAISRKILNKEGKILYDGKSLWHLLAENSVLGNDIFKFMMRKQEENGFGSFYSYFDFDYVDKNKMNAIVYTASLSGPQNNNLLNSMLSELIESYPVELEIQAKINATCLDIVKLKYPGNVDFVPVCISFANEIRALWEEKEAEKFKNSTMISQVTSFAASIMPTGQKSSLDHEKLLSAIFASMAFYCVEGHPIPKTSDQYSLFLNKIRNGNFLEGSLKELLHDAQVRIRVAENIAKYITEQTILLQFAENQQDLKIKKIALDISTNIPIPSKEEQLLIKAILSGETLENNKLISDLVYYNKKFNGKNLIWLAVEANKPDVVAMLYVICNRHFMDDAGPEGSVFSFSAKQENKDCFDMICSKVTEETLLAAGFTRFKIDDVHRIAAHYVFESGKIDNILNYIQTEMRYYTTRRNFKRLTGGPDEQLSNKSKFYSDKDGNTPLHLLVKRSDALSIFNKLNDFANKNNLTLLHLFDVGSLRLSNQEGQTPLMIIYQNSDLKKVFFDALLSPNLIEKHYSDTDFQKNVVTCLEYAVLDNDWSLVDEFNKAMKLLHQRNIGYGYATNPVELLVSSMLDNVLKKYQHEDTTIEQRNKILDNLNVWCDMVPAVKVIELINKLENSDLTANNYFLVQPLLKFATNKKLIDPTSEKKYADKFKINIENSSKRNAYFPSREVTRSTISKSEVENDKKEINKNIDNPKP